MSEVILETLQGKSVAVLSDPSVTASGHIYPLARIELYARVANETISSIEPRLVQTKLRSSGETLCQGIWSSGDQWIFGHPRRQYFEVPISQEAIALLSEEFASNDYVRVELRLSGLLCVAYAGSPARDEWFRERGLEIEISKTDWLRRVLEPIGHGHWFTFIMKAPVMEPGLWPAAQQRLGAAWQQLELGHSRDVFSECYDALDSFFSGREIDEQWLQSVVPSTKQEAVKALFRQVRRFWNEGRHLAGRAPTDPQFPPDPRDAEIAYILARTLLTYLAKLNR